MMSKVLINGVSADFLNVNDRAIHYGDGLFETILCNNKQLYYWQQHFKRLQTSAEKLKIACPEEQDFLSDIALLLNINDILDESAYVIKIILTRGTGERGYQFKKAMDSTRIVILSDMEINNSSLLSGKLLKGELFLCKQQVSINESLAGLKHLNRLENVLARNEKSNEAVNNKFIDGLMVNANQHIIEGTMSNLFAVKDNQLFTPDLSQSGVNGIMRDVIMDKTKENNIQLSVVNMQPDELFTMDELFISNSLIGIKSVTKLDNFAYKDSKYTQLIFNDIMKTKEDDAQLT
jgi:4-amino-4-deoxychorismate lyase